MVIFSFNIQMLIWINFALIMLNIIFVFMILFMQIKTTDIIDKLYKKYENEKLTDMVIFS